MAMAQGPLAVRFGSWTLDDPEAGVVGSAEVELGNAGTIRWNDAVHLSYHWLDDLDNPIVWDGIRTPLPPLEPGESATVTALVRAPIPPGRYRFAFDVVVEHRAWLSELGPDQTVAGEFEVASRTSSFHSDLPENVEPTADWAERVGAAHADGFAVVAGALEWAGGLFDRQPRELDPYRPGPGRIPGFAQPLVCPSVVDGIELERLPDLAGLPAFAAPQDEPWIYDGRIVLRARSRSGRPPG
jgi:hypothetical protein